LLSIGLADCNIYIRRPAFEFWSRKDSDFPEWLQTRTRYDDAAISNSRM